MLMNVRMRKYGGQRECVVVGAEIKVIGDVVGVIENGNHCNDQKVRSAN